MGAQAEVSWHDGKRCRRPHGSRLHPPQPTSAPLFCPPHGTVCRPHAQPGLQAPAACTRGRCATCRRRGGRLWRSVPAWERPPPPPHPALLGAVPHAHPACLPRPFAGAHGHRSHKPRAPRPAAGARRLGGFDSHPARRQPPQPTGHPCAHPAGCGAAAARRPRQGRTRGGAPAAWHAACWPWRGSRAWAPPCSGAGCRARRQASHGG